MPPTGAVWNGCGPIRSLGVAGLVGRAHFGDVVAGFPPSPQPEHSPGVYIDFGGQLCGLPLAVVDAHLDLVDAFGLRPGNTCDRSVWADSSEGAGTVDPGHRLDRGLLPPAALQPISPLRVERGEFHIGEPLGPGHESVKSGDNHSNRESVLDW